jgi:hypothetical protein
LVTIKTHRRFREDLRADESYSHPAAAEIEPALPDVIFSVFVSIAGTSSDGFSF